VGDNVEIAQDSLVGCNPMLARPYPQPFCDCPPHVGLGICSPSLDNRECTFTAEVRTNPIEGFYQNLLHTRITMLADTCFQKLQAFVRAGRQSAKNEGCQ